MGLDISHYHATNNRKAENNEVFPREDFLEDCEGSDEDFQVYAKFVYSYNDEQFLQARNVGYAGKILNPAFYKEWQGSPYITNIDRLWKLRSYCKEEYLEHFDSQFTNQWREGTSLITLSW